MRKLKMIACAQATTVMMMMLFLAGVAPALAAEKPAIDGEKLFRKNCSVCHGDNGDGQSRARRGLLTKPRDFTKADPTKLTRDQMINSITYGIPKTPMVRWKERFSQEQIGTIVDFIHENFMIKNNRVDLTWWGDARGTDMSLAFADGLKGNLVNGKRLYEQSCVACHGKKGDGEGPRAYFNKPKPRNFQHERSRNTLNRPRIFSSISMGLTGSVMPAWSKVLTNQQIADVGEYVFQTFIKGGDSDGDAPS